MAEGDLGFFPGTDFDLLANRIRRFSIRRWSRFHDRDRTGRDTLHCHLTVTVLVAEWPECLAFRWDLDRVAGHRQAIPAILEVLGNDGKTAVLRSFLDCGK